MTRADELRAELAMAEAEEAFVALKGKKTAKPDEVRAAKDEVRAARKAFRETREG
jgi:Mg-chelatase subunit ChlI